jgi:hypothetical protein
LVLNAKFQIYICWSLLPKRERYRLFPYVWETILHFFYLLN